MWEPPHLTTLWASMASYRDSFSFTFFPDNKLFPLNYSMAANPIVPDLKAILLMTKITQLKLSYVKLEVLIVMNVKITVSGM
jgi:hypothetical protein